MPQNERKKILYWKRKAEKLCVYCAKPMDREGSLCCECNKKMTESMRKMEECYINAKVCPRCRTKRLYDGERKCLECRVKDYNRKMSNPARLEKDRIRRQERVKEWKNKGSCSACGKELETDYKFKTCLKCRISARKRNKRYREKKKDYDKIERRYRYEYGLCFFCDNKVIPGKKMCEKHYEMNRINRMKILENNKENMREYSNNYGRGKY